METGLIVLVGFGIIIIGIYCAIRHFMYEKDERVKWWIKLNWG